MAAIPGPRNEAEVDKLFVHVSCGVSLQAYGMKVRLALQDGEIRGVKSFGVKNPGRCVLCKTAGGGVVRCNYHEIIKGLWEDGRSSAEEQREASCPCLVHPRCAREQGWIAYTEPLLMADVVCCENHSRPGPAQKLKQQRARRLASNMEIEKAYEDGLANAESRNQIRRAANRAAAESSQSESGKVLRQAFLWDNWGLFGPFLPEDARPRTSRLAQQVLGAFATEDATPVHTARAKIMATRKKPPDSQPTCVVGGTMRDYQVSVIHVHDCITRRVATVIMRCLGYGSLYEPYD